MKQTHLFKNRHLTMELSLGPFRISGKNPTPVLATIQKWVETEGHTFQFYSGKIIHVILNEGVFDQTGLYPDLNSTVILDLESPDLVRFSNEHIGTTRWFCRRDPKEIVGPLLDHYRGTYYLKHLNQLVYSSENDLEYYDLPQHTLIDSTLLAAVCAAREAGIKAETIRSRIVHMPNSLNQSQVGPLSSSSLTTQY